MKALPSLLALCGALLAISSPGLAAEEKFRTSIVNDEDAITLDPAKGYLLVEAPDAAAITFFKIPSAETRDADRKKRSEARVRAHAQWVKDYARYKVRLKNYQRSPGSFDRPVEPLEPTEEGFAWEALELKRMVTLGPLNRFRKSDAASLYLQAVTPGEYVYYGTVSLGLGACACMGTVKFDVAPGKVTTLSFDYAFMDRRGNLLRPRHEVPNGADDIDAGTRTALILAQGGRHVADPRLPADLLVEANFRAMPSLPNWFGAEVNRLQPIPGVLDYDRDKVIDLKAGQAAGSP
jgi:hypothetical protein